MVSRNSLRIPRWDYSGYGWYHITICIQGKERILGNSINGNMHTSVSGLIVHYRWQWLQWFYPFVQIDEWQVMPNHIHGIVVIGFEGGARSGNKCSSGAWPRAATARTPSHNWNAPFARTGKKKPLGNLVGAFKTTTTKLINSAMEFPTGTKIWQRNFYEQIIRDDKELEAIRCYIKNNPQNWETDEENMSNII